MSRLKRFVHTVASSHALILISMFYQLASVPLALHFLSKEQFGLWALMTQIANYMMLVDVGITHAIARQLIDHKDRRDGGTYGSLLQTGWCVLAIQAVVLLVVGISLGSWLERLLRISPEFHADFPVLIRWLCIFQAFVLTTRVLPQILYAHQRYEIVNYASMVEQPICLVVLWTALHAGQGVFSYLWPLGVSLVIDVIILLVSCVRLDLLPHRGAWGRPSWQLFRELFSFGKDAFMSSIGFQLMMASQTLIITRNLGLTVAATWAICTKAYSFLYMVLWRIVDFSIPAFSEMVARGEREQLRSRLRDLVMFIGALVVPAGVVFAVCNQSFVAIWTRGRISWWAGNDVLLAAWLMVNTLAHCHSSFVPATGKIGAMRYVYFLEGAVFVLLAGIGTRWFGISALLAASVICTTSISGSYGVYHTARFCGFSWREVALSWQKPLARELLLVVPIAVLVWWCSRSLPSVVRLPLNGILVGVPAVVVMLRYGIAPSIQVELYRFLPGRIQSAFRRWLAWS